MGSEPESDAHRRALKLFLGTRHLLRGRIGSTRDAPPGPDSPPVAARQSQWSERRERVELLVELRNLGVIDQRQFEAEKQGIREVRNPSEPKASSDG